MNIIKVLKKNMNIIRKNGSYIEKIHGIYRDEKYYEMKSSVGFAG